MVPNGADHEKRTTHAWYATFAVAAGYAIPAFASHLR